MAHGVDAEGLQAVHAALLEAHAVPLFVGARLGAVTPATGEPVAVDVTLETMPSVLFDAVVLPDGQASAATLASLGHAVDFVKEQYRHGKTLFVMGAGSALLDAAAVSATLPGGEPDPGIVVSGSAGKKGKRSDSAGADGSVDAFIAALAKHRHFAREQDPPPV